MHGASVVTWADLWQVKAVSKIPQMSGSGSYAKGDEGFIGVYPAVKKEDFSFAALDWAANGKNTYDQSLHCVSYHDNTLTSIVDSNFQNPGPEAAMVIKPGDKITTSSGTAAANLERDCFNYSERWQHQNLVGTPAVVSDERSTGSTPLPTDGPSYAKRGPVQAAIAFLATKGDLWRDQTIDKNGTIVRLSFASGGAQTTDKKNGSSYGIAEYFMQRTPQGTVQRFVCQDWVPNGNLTSTVVNNFNTMAANASHVMPSKGLSPGHVVRGQQAETNLEVCIDDFERATQEEASVRKYGAVVPLLTIQEH